MSRSSTDPRMPVVGVTMGDGAGIGPEIILAALAKDPETAQTLAVYGCPKIMELTRAHLAPQAPALPSLDLDAYRADPVSGPVLVDVTSRLPTDAQIWLRALTKVPFGEPHPCFAWLQGVALECAIEDALGGRIDAICTAPWTKSIFSLIGEEVRGHTEVLARRTQAPHHTMMLAGEVLRVALVTTHVPLREVGPSLSLDMILATTRTTHHALAHRFGCQTPRIAVCALNPHAGERGAMGDEEERVIGPAIEQARAEGICCEGPFAADTLFTKLGGPQPWPWDAVVCMYHDQGLIPLKLHHFGQAANITLGLPIVRTSVDHGTAYDIAGQGVADPSSMRYAIALAHSLLPL